MVDHVPPSVLEADTCPYRLLKFYVNDAVICTIIKGPRPTSRHVSRTPRFYSDWLFHKIHLETSISVWYVLTTDHLADILTDDHAVEVFDATLRAFSPTLFL